MHLGFEVLKEMAMNIIIFCAVKSGQLLATGWTTEGSEFECRQDQEFSLLHVVHTGSGAHPAS
jgi:hypothetical protein